MAVSTSRPRRLVASGLISGHAVTWVMMRRLRALWCGQTPHFRVAAAGATAVATLYTHTILRVRAEPVIAVSELRYDCARMRPRAEAVRPLLSTPVMCGIMAVGLERPSTHFASPRAIRVATNVVEPTVDASAPQSADVLLFYPVLSIAQLPDSVATQLTAI